jgi:hypothetical protein
MMTLLLAIMEMVIIAINYVNYVGNNVVSHDDGAVSDMLISLEELGMPPCLAIPIWNLFISGLASR